MLAKDVTDFACEPNGMKPKSPVFDSRRTQKHKLDTIGI